jgi:hypothetical protein
VKQKVLDERVIRYQFSLPEEDYISKAPLGTTFFDNKFYSVPFCPIPDPEYNLGLEDFTSGNDFSKWFKQLAFHVRNYCAHNNYPEPSISITTNKESQFFVQTIPIVGTPEYAYSTLVSPPKNHEFVFILHGHAANYDKKNIINSLVALILHTCASALLIYQHKWMLLE